MHGQPGFGQSRHGVLQHVKIAGEDVVEELVVEPSLEAIPGIPGYDKEARVSLRADSVW